MPSPSDPLSSGHAVAALSEVAAKAGVEVRVEPFALALAGKGGLCRIDGRWVILVDAKLTALEQAGVIGEALAGIDLEGELPPSLRAYVKTGHGEVKALPRPRPLARTR